MLARLCVSLILLGIYLALSSPVFGLPQAQNKAPNEINWITDDKLLNKSRTPGNGKQSGYQSLNVNAATADLVLQQLTGFKVRPQFVNNNRALQILEDNSFACAGKTIRTEAREEFMIFSDLPQVIFPGLRVYYRADDKRFGAHDNGQETLAELMKAQPNLRIGITAGRSYSNVYDNLFSQPEWGQQIWRRSGRESHIALVEMLMNKRIDMMLEYPIVIQNILTQRDASPARLNSFTPADAEPTILGYFACSRSEFGERVIQAINQEHLKISKQRVYLDAHLQWLESDLQEDFVHLYNTIYGTSFSLN